MGVPAHSECAGLLFLLVPESPCKKVGSTGTTVSMESSTAITEARSTDAAIPGARTQDDWYAESMAHYGASLARLARGYEAQPDRRQDLLQAIHIAVWQSFAIFDGRCSLRTWVYRVAHITATKHIVSDRRMRWREMYTLDEVPEPEDPQDAVARLADSDTFKQLLSLIESLKPIDRQIILLYLEDFSAEAIGEVVGLSSENIATKIHRIKKLLARMNRDRGAQ